MKTTLNCTLALIVAVLLAERPTYATVVLGTGDSALLGGDLTDPENDADPGNLELDVGYNATFLSSSDNGFGGGENAWNVFDSRTGGNNNKWCCNTGMPQWVQATLPVAYQLTHFTITSANDARDRDPVSWSILGSNDGTNFTPIFVHTGSNVFNANPLVRNEVILFDAGNFAGQGNSGSDFALGGLYTTFRFEVTAFGGDANGFQLGELEFFGRIPPVIPEPGTWALCGVGIAGLAWRIRRRK